MYITPPPHPFKRRLRMVSAKYFFYYQFDLTYNLLSKLLRFTFSLRTLLHFVRLAQKRKLNDGIWCQQILKQCLLYYKTMYYLVCVPTIIRFKQKLIIQIKSKFGLLSFSCEIRTFLVDHARKTPNRSKTPLYTNKVIKNWRTCLDEHALSVGTNQISSSGTSRSNCNKDNSIAV